MNGAFTPGLMKKMKHALPKRYCSNPAKQMGESTHTLGHNRSENVLMKTSYPDSYLMQTGKKAVSEIKENIPTRNDSVVSAYHNRHMFNKTESYLNDPFYDPHKKKAADVAQKFPSLDEYMKTQEGRESVGQGG